MTLEEHIREHPSDCQAIVAYLKRRSKEIENRDREILQKRLRRVSEIKHGEQRRK